MSDESRDAPPTDALIGLAPNDWEVFSENMAEVTRLSGRLAAAMTPAEPAEDAASMMETQGEYAKTFADVWRAIASDPERLFRAQTDLWRSYFALWDFSARRMAGETAEPVVPHDARDKRFKDDAWTRDPAYDVLRQGYLALDGWARALIDDAEDLDDHTRHKAGFYLNQILAAASPSNHLATNPELMRLTMAENGANLVRGLKALARDFEAGEGRLKVRQSDTSPFELGRNIAVTPGAVVYRNHLFELLQYAPATETVRRRPLLITPPWINKFYVLDLNEEKSMIRWLVARGHTVFIISWVNPDERHAASSFDDYMSDGILKAVETVCAVTGEETVDAVGYCIGGTLLSATLGHMARIGDARIASCTLLTTQVDFTHAGDLKVFADEEQIEAIERRMAKKGYLEGGRMADAFNMLRPDDLIWPYVVNNYLRGKDPFPFDLLYWNADSTRMPAANHAFYLRHCYLRNDLANGRMVIAGEAVDLGRVTVPVYNLATRDDHIAPARSVYKGCDAFGGEVRYVLSGSGHIAGVVNPPSRGKYRYWTGDRTGGSFEGWIEAAEETPGSWWPDWDAWLRSRSDETVAAREIGATGFSAIEPAPGAYVRVKG